jgi:hypothetical protein
VRPVLLLAQQYIQAVTLLQQLTSLVMVVQLARMEPVLMEAQVLRLVAMVLVAVVAQQTAGQLVLLQELMLHEMVEQAELVDYLLLAGRAQLP